MQRSSSILRIPSLFQVYAEESISITYQPFFRCMQRIHAYHLPARSRQRSSSLSLPALFQEYAEEFITSVTYQPFLQVYAEGSISMTSLPFFQVNAEFISMTYLPFFR